MRHRIYGAIALSLALLAGCAANIPLQRSQTAGLAKGTPASQAEGVASKATVQASHEFQVQERRFLAKHYNLQTGLRQDMTMVCTTFCFPVMIDVPILTPYVMVYEAEGQRLVAWGTVEELSRSPDEEISSIMPPLKQSYERELAKKKNAS
jgi:hypothetical protein